MTLTLKILASPLLSSETIHDIFFTCSRHTNFTGNLYIVGLFLPFDLDSMTFTLIILSGSLLSNYISMATGSHFQSMATNIPLHLWSIFVVDPLNFVLEIMTFVFKILFANSCLGQPFVVNVMFLVVNVLHIMWRLAI